MEKELHQAILTEFPQDSRKMIRKAVHDGIQGILNNRSNFSLSQLEDRVVRKVDTLVNAGSFPLNQRESELFGAAVEMMIAEANLYRISDSNNYSSHEMVRMEKNILRISLLEDPKYLIPEHLVRDALAQRPTISEEQLRAVEYGCLSPRLLASIEGTAGAGKSFTMWCIKQAFETAGYRIIGTALAYNASGVLGTSIGIENCPALSVLLASIRKAKLSGVPYFTGPTCIIVDEAGMVGTEMAHELLQAAAEAEFPIKIFFTGDSKQVQPVAAGNVLHLVTSKAPSVRINEIRRQKLESHRQAVYDLADGRAGAAMHTYLHQELVHMCSDRNDLFDMVAQHYVSYRRACPDKSALIVSVSNRDVIEMNERIRAVNKKIGLIRGKDIKIEVTNTVDTWAANFAPGDEVVLRATGGDVPIYKEVVPGSGRVVEVRKGVFNRNRARVIDVHRSVASPGTYDMVVEIFGDSPGEFVGRAVLNTGTYKAFGKKGFPVHHNFATTIYGGQGQTVNKTFFVSGPMLSRPLAYVGCSRHTEELELYVDLQEAHAALQRDRRKSTPAGYKDPKGKFGQDPPVIPQRIGLFTRTAIAQYVASVMSRESNNLTVTMFEEAYNMDIKKDPMEDRKLSLILPGHWHGDAQREPEFSEVIDTRYPQIDMKALHLLEAIPQEAELVRPGEVDINNATESNTIISVRDNKGREPFRYAIQPEAPTDSPAQQALFSRAASFINNLMSRHSAVEVPEPEITNRQEDPDAPFEIEVQGEFEEDGSQKVSIVSAAIAGALSRVFIPAPPRADLPFLELPRLCGQVQADGTIDFGGVPRTHGPDSDTSALSDDFVKEMRGAVWQRGRYGEPRILGYRTDDAPGTTPVNSRYRLDGTCVVGDGYPPILYSAAPSGDTPVVIVPGPYEMFLVADKQRERHGEDSPTVPHVIWAAKDMDWSLIAKALEGAPLTILRSKESPQQEKWARSLQNKLSSRFNLDVRVSPPLPEPAPAQAESARVRRTGP